MAAWRQPLHKNAQGFSAGLNRGKGGGLGGPSPESFSPAKTKKLKSICEKLRESMKDEGEYAVQIFMEMWEEYQHDILLDSENLQKALIGAIRQELKDTGLEVPRGSPADVLQYLGDGTYPIDTLAVERTTGGRDAYHGARKDFQTDEEVVAGRTAPPEFVEVVNEPKERDEQGGSVEKN